MRGFVVVGIALATVAGCGTSSPRQLLARRAEEEGALPCGVATGEVRQLAENAMEVRGCGQIVEYTDTRAGRGRRWEPMRPAASLASEALHCALDALAPSGTQTAQQRSFEGCGYHITYVLSCSDDGGCVWVAGAAPQAAAWGPAPSVTP